VHQLPTLGPDLALLRGPQAFHRLSATLNYYVLRTATQHWGNPLVERI